jgi:hypothetical protein
MVELRMRKREMGRFIMRNWDLDISKMYFSLWKPSEVSERMWSVNLDGSISGEYLTIGGHSGRPSE